MITIRLAQPNDLEAWSHLYKQYLEFYETSLSQEQLLKLWNWFFSEEEKIYCYVANVENKLVGLVHFREFLRPLRASAGIFMDDLFVDSNSRGRGIAQKLIHSVKQFAAQKNYSVVRWVTGPDNHEAMMVYNKLAIKTPWVMYDMPVG
jgi:GNAT superfamily N-acetyltransferase